MHLPLSPAPGVLRSLASARPVAVYHWAMMTTARATSMTVPP